MSFFDRFKSGGRGQAAPRDTAAVPTGEVADIIERLRRFVSEESEAAFQPADVDPREHIFEAGYVDSLSATTLVAFVQDEYGVRIHDMDLVDRCSTLEGLAAFVVAARAR